MRQAYDYGQTLIIVFQNTKIDSKSTFWMKNVFFKQNSIRKLIFELKNYETSIWLRADPNNCVSKHKNWLQEYILNEKRLFQTKFNKKTHFEPKNYETSIWLRADPNNCVSKHKNWLQEYILNEKRLFQTKFNKKTHFKPKKLWDKHMTTGRP